MGNPEHISGSPFVNFRETSKLAVAEQIVFEPKKEADPKRLEKARKMLNFLVEMQREAVGNGKSSSLLRKTGVELCREARHSHLFDEVEAEAKREVLRIDSKEDYSTGLRGMAFAKIAFGYISAHEAAKGNAVIPEEGALALRRILNPEAEDVLDNPFGRKGLAGVYVPDGLIVNRKGLITGVLEYTLSSSRDKLIHQQKGFGHLSREMKTLIDQREGVEFIYVTPADSRGKQLNLVHEERFSDIDFQSLPVTRHDFGEFIHDAYSKYINQQEKVQALLA